MAWQSARSSHTKTIGLVIGVGRGQVSGDAHRHAKAQFGQGVHNVDASHHVGDGEGPQLPVFGIEIVGAVRAGPKIHKPPFQRGDHLVAAPQAEGNARRSLGQGPLDEARRKADQVLVGDDGAGGTQELQRLSV